MATLEKNENKKFKNVSVFGIFNERTNLEKAVADLKTQGFRNADISFVAPESLGWGHIEHERATKAPEGATTGASAGAIVGGALGWLMGIGSIAIPGFGPFIAAGPIMGLLAGIGMGGTVGGATGALIGLGMSEYEAERVVGGLKEGNILLAVHCDDGEWTQKAKTVLNNNKATQVATKTDKEKASTQKDENYAASA